MHVAWVILQRVIARAFDFDARLVGVDRLDQVVRPVCENMLKVTADLAGGLDAQAQSQLQLPGCYGGLSLRVTARGTMANAARWAGHVATQVPLHAILQSMGRHQRQECEEAC